MLTVQISTQVVNSLADKKVSIEVQTARCMIKNKKSRYIPKESSTIVDVATPKTHAYQYKIYPWNRKPELAPSNAPILSTVSLKTKQKKMRSIAQKIIRLTFINPWRSQHLGKEQNPTSNRTSGTICPLRIKKAALSI